jgi:nicotinate-nucleotide pyrophosphorylase (carboxylating)
MHLLPPTFGLQIDQFIAHALEEDYGDGDHTSLATISNTQIGTGLVKYQTEGIVAGLEIASKIFLQVDPRLSIIHLAKDGDLVSAGTVVIKATGSTQSLLRAERVVLNIMQRMSGIATTTNEYVQLIKGTSTKILDTRKTTPNFRYFEKLAVLIGGGANHRYGLYDMILIKDNHVDACGGIANALKAAKAYLQKLEKHLKIEIETRNMEEVKQALSMNIADRIMLDNFTPSLLSEAVKLINGAVETEASGGINKGTIRQYALTGVDYISLGALTHSYQSVDINMKISN